MRRLSVRAGSGAVGKPMHCAEPWEWERGYARAGDNGVGAPSERP
jgi:hypothetical protein